MFRLATGRYSDCPFTDQVPPHQPFFLAAIEVKTRKYDESDYTPVAANYSSAKEIRIEVAGGQPGRNTKGPGDIAKVMDVCQNSDCGPRIPMLPIRRQQRRRVGEPRRLVIRLMLDSFLFQLLFADDLKFLVLRGLVENKYVITGLCWRRCMWAARTLSGRTRSARKVWW